MSDFMLMNFKDLLSLTECECVLVEKRGEDEVRVFDGWPDAIPMKFWRRRVLSFRKTYSKKTVNILIAPEGGGHAR